MRITQRIEFIADVLPQLLDLLVLLLEFSVAIFASDAARLSCSVLVLVYLGKGLLGLAVLQLKEARREEGFVVLDGTTADDVVITAL